jgi:PAS domain S-box-containing protein
VGVAEARITPQDCIALVHPEDREKLVATRTSDLQGAISDEGEVQYRIVRPDGDVRWLIVRRRTYFEGEGGARRAVRVLGVMMDITQQKRAEQELACALRESDQERGRLAALLETMPAGILLADRSNRVLEGNAEALQIWGAESVEELADRGFDLQGWRAGSAEPLRVDEWPPARALRGEKVLGEIIDIQRFDGSRATIFNSASPVRDANGNLQGAVSVMVDVTEQRQIELALRSSEESLRLAHGDLERLLEQKNVLFREVQHRVKNNLQVVSSLLSLEAQRFEDREFNKAMNESRDRVRSMALMHEKFCHLDDLARIEFRDYVNELARYFFSSYMAEPSAIEFSSDVDVRLSMDDAIPCGLILQELLSNSVKHAFPQGTGQIRIDFHAVDGKFEMRYRDDGVGLPKKMDLKNPATLGLQLVTDLAGQLQGDLRYEYQDGAHFTLTFA